ncbi:MAG: glycan-binding surface protein, partial [Bacteroidales bacterium]|nr:glycan-binding surface protein [Bacteroidales bacterium]
LDKVTSIDLPGAEGITDITVVGKYEIRITIPQTAEPGLIVLNTPEGKITSKTPIGYSEPISISSIAPLELNPGAVLTIEGDYLNIVEEVIFADGVHVLKADFDSQTRAKIEVKVPLSAQSGKVIVSNGADLLSGGDEIPVWVYSDEEINVALPTYESSSTGIIKAGNPLVITGENLNWVAYVKFQDALVSEVELSEDATTLTVVVPKTAQSGEVILVSFSEFEVAAGEIQMVVPSELAVAPAVVKNGTDLSISGIDLDLVVDVTFPNVAEAVDFNEEGASATEIVVAVPETAQDGDIVLNMLNGDQVSVAFETVKPTISEFVPAALTAGEGVSITGTDLDLVHQIIFPGEGSPTVTIEEGNYVDVTTLNITVPTVAETGAPKLVMKNGMTIETTVVLNVAPATDPAVATMPEKAMPGDVITLTGKNLNYVESLFIGDAKVMEYTSRTAEELVFTVPSSVDRGEYNIKLVNFEGAEFFSEAVILIVKVEPVQDASYVFFDFDGKGSWWGSYGVVEAEPALVLSGNYFRINADLPAGWVDFFWRNGGNDLKTDNVTVADWVIKMDVNVLGGTTQDFKFRLKGSDGDFWAIIPGMENNGGWYTVTIPLTDFYDQDGTGTNQLPNVQNIDSDFGMATAGAAGAVNMCIDNIRFESKQ